MVAVTDHASSLNSNWPSIVAVLRLTCPFHRVIVSLYVGATPMGVAKKRVPKSKYYFVILNSVLVLMNNVFAPMVGVKMGCYFNNSMFFIKKYN